MKTNHYRATAHTKEARLLDYKKGFAGDQLCFEADIAIRGQTPSRLRENLREFFGPYQATVEDCEIDWSPEDPGEIRVRLMEDAEGCGANQDDIEKWKRGEIELYDVTYILSVVKEMQVKPEEVPS